ncbi:unnamed protein product, partial [Prorocentrum cordatum]
QECGVPVLLLEVPFISIKIAPEVPRAEDAVRALGAILQYHGFEQVVCVGHSFGTVVLGWLWRYAPERVAGLALLDPIVVLLFVHTVLYNFLYQKPALLNPLDRISSEFFLAHGLRRNFWWYECILWPEDLPPSLPFLAILAEKDEIAPAPLVHRHLAAAAGWCATRGPGPGVDHGVLDAW